MMIVARNRWRSAGSEATGPTNGTLDSETAQIGEVIYVSVKVCVKLSVE